MTALSPLDERAPAKLHDRLARMEAKVFYTTDLGCMRVEIAPEGWWILNAQGVLWTNGFR